MPRPTKKARLARSQRPNGSKAFTNGLIQDIEELKVDPSYVPDTEEPESEGEEPLCYFSIVKDDGSGQWVDCEEDDDENSDVNEEDEEALVDQELDGIEAAVKAAKTFWKHLFSQKPKTKAHFTGGARSTYSGTSRSHIYAMQRELRIGARGSHRIDSFFRPRVRTPARSLEPEHELEGPPVDEEGENQARVPPTEVTSIESESENSESTVSDSDVEIPTSPGPVTARESSPEHLPEPNNAAARSSDGSATPISSSPQYPVTEFLDTTDDDDEPRVPATVVETNVRIRMEKMLALAKKHKSVKALYKLHTLKQYLDLRAKFRLNPRIKNPAQRASLAIARAVGRGPYLARQVRHLESYIHRFNTLPPGRAGKHHAHPSLLNDERVLMAVRRYLTVLANGEITPLKLMKEVNEVIMPGLGLSLGKNKISAATARRWLCKLGYTRRLITKGAYFDGHERPDVVEYRKKFLGWVQENERFRTKYIDGELIPAHPEDLRPGEKRQVDIFQDEMCVNVNDLKKHAWIQGNKMPLRKKGAGRAIHTSDFTVEEYGRLRLTQEQVDEEMSKPAGERLTSFDAREIIYPGKNYDGWWNADRLLAQLRRAVPIFKRLYPDCIGNWYFDHSTGHSAFAPDALNAREMNVKPGGSQRTMHDTIIPDDNPHPHLRGQVQQMNFPHTLPPTHPHYEHRGKPKGMKVVLQERGLYDQLLASNGGKFVGVCQDCKLSEKARDQRAREAAAAQIGVEEEEAAWEDVGDELDVDPIPRSETCCMRRVLSLQKDFREEKCMIQRFLEDEGQNCYFIPKYHCEFNPIEMYWGWVKMRYRYLADGTFATAKVLLPEILDSCPTKTIRAFFRKAWRYMDAYSKGLSPKQVEYAVKKYRSHRRVPASALMDVEMLTNEA